MTQSGTLKTRAEQEAIVFAYLDTLVYLDKVVECGVIDLTAAGASIERRFWLGGAEARAFLAAWMETYSVRHP